MKAIAPIDAPRKPGTFLTVAGLAMPVCEEGDPLLGVVFNGWRSEDACRQAADQLSDELVGEPFGLCLVNRGYGRWVKDADDLTGPERFFFFPEPVKDSSPVTFVEAMYERYR